MFDAKGYDCYMGVLRRSRPSGKAQDVVDHAPVLWADIDPYKGEKVSNGLLELARDVNFARAINFPLAPSIIVDSGHGIHAYWLLREAMALPDATLAMKGIAKDIGGDHTHDPARVLRLPGTNNHKGGDSIPVRLLRLDTTRRYRPSDFTDYIEKGGEPRGGTPARWHHPEEYPRRLDLPEWLSELIYNGAERGSRSEQAFKAMVWLLRYGWTQPEIYDAFIRGGIGEKMRERGQAGGDRWFTTTFRAAEQQA